MGLKHKYTFEHFEVWYTDYIENRLKKLGYTQLDIEKLAKQLAGHATSTPPSLKGDVIKKTGGAIKLRLSPKKSSKGSRGEDRLIYCFLNHYQFFFLAIYEKSAQESLSSGEIEAIAHAVKELKVIFKHPK